MLKVGITGGIGSGKTTVAHIFEVLGIPVYFADESAKRLMQTNAVLKQQLIAAFGESTYTNGILNKAHLSKIVFDDADQLAVINSIVHPATFTDADAWMLAQTMPYALKEAALIFETDAWKHLDLVIGVSAPLHLRIQRTVARDGISESEVMARLEKQMPQAEKMLKCNYEIVNDDEQMIIPQVIKIHEALLTLTAP